MSKIEKFIKTSSIYFFGNVFNKVISFFLLPLYTNRIVPESYGNYNLIQSLINLIIPIIFFQIWDAVFRFSFNYKSDDEKYVITSNGLFVMLIGLIIYSIFYSIFVFLFDIDYKLLIFFYSIGIGIQYYYGVIARSFQKNLLFVISGGINGFLTIIFNLIFILVFDMGINALYASSIIGTTIQVLIITFNLKPISKIKIKSINFKLIKKMLKFSIPLTVGTLTLWLLTGLTQFLISFSVGNYANGLYAVANKFSSILILLAGVFQFAWNEMAYDVAKDENKEEYYSRGITEFFKIIIYGSCVFILIIKLIFPYFVDYKYNDALGLIPIILLGTCTNSYSSLLGTIFLANENSKDLSITVIIASITNVIGLLILIPLWGLYGAAISLCISFIIGMISRLIMLYRLYGIKPNNNFSNPIILLIVSILSFYKVSDNLYTVVILLIIILISLLSMKSLLNIILKIFIKKKTLDKKVLSNK